MPVVSVDGDRVSWAGRRLLAGRIPGIRTPLCRWTLLRAPDLLPSAMMPDADTLLTPRNCCSPGPPLRAALSQPDTLAARVAEGLERKLERRAQAATDQASVRPLGA